MPLAHSARCRDRFGRLGPSARLTIGADGRGDGVEAHIEGQMDRVRCLIAGVVQSSRARSGGHLGVHGEAPRPECFDHFVTDGTDLQHGVDHFTLFLDRSVRGQLAPGQPDRHAHIHRPFVGADPDAGEETGVRARIEGIEVVRLAPGGVALDGVGQVVTGFKDGHA